jgi:oligopeptide transport system substrate-binding protein
VRPVHERRGALLGLLVIAVLLAGCSDLDVRSQADPMPENSPRAVVGGEPQSPGVFTVFVRQPSSIDPAGAVEADDLLVVRQLFESLTRATPDLRIEPAAATSWEPNEDATVFTFHLRPDATFHDGTSVTAQSFVFAWQRLADRTVDRPSPSHYLLDLVVGIDEAREGGSLDGVVAIDERTLEVTLSTPFADFPALASHPSLAPLPFVAGRRTDFGRIPIGNGPFRMTEPWQPGQFIRLEPYPPHPRATSDLDQVFFRIYEEDDAVERGYGDFLRGLLDLAPIPLATYAEAVREFGRSPSRYEGPGVIDGARMTTAFYVFNVDIPPFDDPAVRRAIALLVDRDRIAEAAGTRTRVPLTSIVPPLFETYTSPECGYCTPSIARARQILEEAEIEIGPIDLVHLDSDEHTAAARVVAEDVNRALGRGTLNLVALSRPEWAEAIRSGETGFFLSGWIGEYPSPGAFLDSLFHPSRVGSDNVSRFVSPELDELFNAVRTELDPQVRADLYHEIEAILLDEMPVIPLTVYRHGRLVSARTVGLTMDPFGGVDLSQVSLREAE